MKTSPTWRAVAQAPRNSPPVMTRAVRGRGCHSRAASPATMQASNMTSGMMVCSICSW
jgi:hypothetical protein